MATADVINKIVEITLTLSMQEAVALRTLLGYGVIGDWNVGARPILSGISTALEDGNVPRLAWNTAMATDNPNTIDVSKMPLFKE